VFAVCGRRSLVRVCSGMPAFDGTHRMPCRGPWSFPSPVLLPGGVTGGSGAIRKRARAVGTGGTASIASCRDPRIQHSATDIGREDERVAAVDRTVRVREVVPRPAAGEWALARRGAARIACGCGVGKEVGRSARRPGHGRFRAGAGAGVGVTLLRSGAGRLFRTLSFRSGRLARGHRGGYEPAIRFVCPSRAELPAAGRRCRRRPPGEGWMTPAPAARVRTAAFRRGFLPPDPPVR